MKYHQNFNIPVFLITQGAYESKKKSEDTFTQVPVTQMQ